MKSRSRPITVQRLDRLLRWSGLWLLRLAAWIVDVVGASAPLERALITAIKPKLNIVAKGICKVIAAKGVLQMKFRRRKADRAPGKYSAHFMRSVLGSETPEALSGSDDKHRALRSLGPGSRSARPG